MLIKAALNGARSYKGHPEIPVFPDQLASASKAAVKAGANALHIHPRDKDGNESLAASDISAAINAIRAAGVTVPIGVSTGEWIEPNINQKLKLIKSWTVLPDFASVNFDERGAEDVANFLQSRNIGWEAGLNSVESTQRFLKFNRQTEALRVLIEIPDLGAKKANKLARDIESILDLHQSGLPGLLHGYETSAWPMIERAAQKKYDTRIGFEDTLFLPTKKIADSNAELVRAAVKIINESSGV